jgi:hypothetical protein
VIVIYIFEENHRFSEKTPHPGPHSVVDAANLAASSRGSQKMFNRDVGAVKFIAPATECPGIEIGSAPAMATFKPPMETIYTNLYIAFQANDPSHNLFLTSSGNGVYFSAPAARIPGIQTGSAPAMAAVNGRLYIAFQANDPSHSLVVTSSPDSFDWTTPGPRIIPGIQIGSAPAMAAFNNRLYIAFQANDRSNALFVTSSADGLNFTTPVVVDPGIRMGSSPAMTVFNNRLYISFQVDDPPSSLLFHALGVTSSPDGINFNTPAIANPGIRLGSAPAMTALGNRLYISFQANDPGHALFVTSSADGVNFTTPATGYGPNPATGSPGILIGSAPASGEFAPTAGRFGQKLFVAFQASDPSHSLFVAASSPVGNAQ